MLGGKPFLMLPAAVFCEARSGTHCRAARRTSHSIQPCFWSFIAGMQFQTWLLFLLTAVGMSLSPGPNSLLAISHGALHGRRKTLFTICGGLCGFVLVIALCMFGIGALLQTSLLWLTALKWVGGLYLAWLGYKLWRSAPVALPTSPLAAPVHTRRRMLFKDGFLSAATNPKGLLFSAHCCRSSWTRMTTCCCNLP